MFRPNIKRSNAGILRRKRRWEHKNQIFLCAPFVRRFSGSRYRKKKAAASALNGKRPIFKMFTNALHRIAADAIRFDAENTAEENLDLKEKLCKAV